MPPTQSGIPWSVLEHTSGSWQFKTCKKQQNKPKQDTNLRSSTDNCYVGKNIQIFAIFYYAPGRYLFYVFLRIEAILKNSYFSTILRSDIDNCGFFFFLPDSLGSVLRIAHEKTLRKYFGTVLLRYIVAEVPRAGKK